jgi:hypothetical protein
MTIHYPEGWETEREGDILVLSPESIGDFYEMEPQPMFIVVSGSQDDWVSEVYEDADRLLDEIADEIMADALGNRQTVEGDGISWRRASAEGTFDLFDQSVEGWLAVTIRGEEFSFVLAVAPGDAWDEYERIFDAMLERIEIG